MKNPETINKVYVRGPPEPAIHRCVRLHHGDPYTKLGPFKLEVRVVNGTQSAWIKKAPTMAFSLLKALKKVLKN